MIVFNAIDITGHALQRPAGRGRWIMMMIILITNAIVNYHHQNDCVLYNADMVTRHDDALQRVVEQL